MAEIRPLGMYPTPGSGCPIQTASYLARVIVDSQVEDFSERKISRVSLPNQRRDADQSEPRTTGWEITMEVVANCPHQGCTSHSHVQAHGPAGPDSGYQQVLERFGRLARALARLAPRSAVRHAHPRPAILCSSYYQPSPRGTWRGDRHLSAGTLFAVG
jgi:hypothetical protein